MSSANSPASLRLTAPLLLSIACLALPLGCKPATPSDATVTQQVNAQLAADSSLAGQSLQATVQSGVVTLSGAVQNDAQRTLASRDAAAVNGVRQVINNVALPIASPPATVESAAPAPLPLTRPAPVPSVLPTRRPSLPPHPAPIQREPAQQAYTPPSPQPPVVKAPPTPPPPAFRTVSIPLGTALPVRVTQTLDSATTQQGDNFSGSIASDVVVDGLVVIPAGSAVTGNVDAVQEAAHFKGNSLLTVSLTGIKDRGERLPLTTDPYTVTGKGRGKNTAEKAGGGAAVGAILGGILGGGRGAAIGAGVGGAGGAGVNAVTRGQQVQIPSESIVRFHIASPLNVRVRTDAVGPSDSGEGLQRRP